MWPLGDRTGRFFFYSEIALISVISGVNCIDERWIHHWHLLRFSPEAWHKWSGLAYKLHGGGRPGPECSGLHKRPANKRRFMWIHWNTVYGAWWVQSNLKIGDSQAANKMHVLVKLRVLSCLQTSIKHYLSYEPSQSVHPSIKGCIMNWRPVWFNIFMWIVREVT